MLKESMSRSVPVRLRAAFRFEPLLIAVPSILFFLLFGAFLLVKTPPYAGPDEPFHWQRVLQIAQGRFLADTLGPNSWGGPIDEAGYLHMIHYFVLIQKHEPVDAAQARALSDHLAGKPPADRVVPFPSSASFAPLAYMPQAAFVAAARAWGLGPLEQAHAGRIGNFAVYGLMILAILRALPGGRLVFLALALSPGALQSACSLSADPLNLMLPALMLALVWGYRERGAPLGPWDMAGLVALSAALGLLKLTMAPFAGVVLYLPAAVAGGSTRFRIGLAALCLGVALGIALLWNMAYPFVPGPYWGTGADPAAQLARLRADPLGTLELFAVNAWEWGLTWWRDSYGRYGGHPSPWSGYAPDRWILPALFVLPLLALCDGARRRDPVVAVGYLLPAPGYVLLIMTAFWIGYTTVGSTTVEGVQGRYFLAAQLLVVLALAAAAGPWTPAGLRRGLRLGLFAAALALSGAVLVHVLTAWSALWVPAG
ncbi:putative membrane protein [Azospirillum brasilense]|nr:putative membrane protein [Azospirillum brasilense]